MDYVERLAGAIWPDYFHKLSGDSRAAQLKVVQNYLNAIAATGCKVVEREQAVNMEEIDGYYRWPYLFDAAPSYPGAADEV